MAQLPMKLFPNVKPVERTNRSLDPPVSIALTLAYTRIAASNLSEVILWISSYTETPRSRKAKLQKSTSAGLPRNRRQAHAVDVDSTIKYCIQ